MIKTLPPHKFPSRTRPVSVDYKLHIESTCVKELYVYWIQHANARGKCEIGAFDVLEEKFLPVMSVPRTDRNFQKFNI